MNFAWYTQKMHDGRKSEHVVTLLLTNNVHVATPAMQANARGKNPTEYVYKDIFVSHVTLNGFNCRKVP